MQRNGWILAIVIVVIYLLITDACKGERPMVDSGCGCDCDCGC